MASVAGSETGAKVEEETAASRLYGLADQEGLELLL